MRLMPLQDRILPIELMLPKPMLLMVSTPQQARILLMVLTIQILGTPPTVQTLQEETLPTLAMSSSPTMERMGQAMAMLPMEPMIPEAPTQMVPMPQDSRILRIVRMVLNIPPMGTPQAQIPPMLPDITTQPMVRMNLDAGTLLMAPTTQ